MRAFTYERASTVEAAATAAAQNPDAKFIAGGTNHHDLL
jgi:xanthine dehydrogenase YagS FAD-binding subunit